MQNCKKAHTKRARATSYSHHFYLRPDWYYKYGFRLNREQIRFNHVLETRWGGNYACYDFYKGMDSRIHDLQNNCFELFLTSALEQHNVPTRRNTMNEKDVKVGKFQLERTVTLKELQNGSKQLEEADYTDRVTVDGELSFLQFKFIPPEYAASKFVMTKGAFYLEMTNSGIKPRKIELRQTKILDSANSAVEIRKRIDFFFNKLDVYKEEGIENPKRGMLVHSAPGVGKTTIISKVISEYVEAHNTCALVWPSDTVHADDVQEFLGSECDWSGIDRFILTIEDLGGGSNIWGHQEAKSPAALLNFLDGIESVFKKPTFIISTTNNADAFQDNLISRPGRFDIVLGLSGPSKEDRLNLLKFFARDRWDMTPEQEREIVKLTDGFSAAHLKEVYLRSRIDDKTMFETAEEIKKHIEKIKSAKGLSMEKKGAGSVGFGGQWDEE